MKWKIVTVLIFILAAAIVPLVIHTQNQRAEKNMLEEEQEFQQMEAPDLKTLQANAKNSFLEECSNDVVGLRRIITTDFGFDDNNPTNWWARANVEYVNPVGSVERKDVWCVFAVLTNSSGGVRDVFSHEDFERIECDKWGDADAEYKMGLRYLNGNHVWKDISTARDYFKKSAAQGNQDAAAEVAKLPQQ